MESEAQPAGHPDNSKEAKETNEGSKAPFFSIVLPVYNYKQVWRAICSALNQTFDDYELVIVSDGCDDGTEKVIQEYSTHPKVVTLWHEERMERLISRNHGMEMARGTWIQPLDRDDELASIALECWKYHIDMNPEYKVMNCAALMHDRRMMPMPDGTEKRFYFWSHRRHVFKPEKVGSEIEQARNHLGHEHFDAGKISTGQFIFMKSLLDELDCWYPDVKSPYTFADVGGIPGYNSKVRTLGNPWGDDFWMFYRLTRKYHSLPIDLCLYYQHIR